MAPEGQSWTRTHATTTYLCTTDPTYIQLDALNAALGSDLVWWAHGMGEADLRKMVDHSLCLGLYAVDAADTRAMVGFARLITDYVTFAYLTDVYVLPEHQGRGLGGWMMECVDAMLGAWPELRRTLLITGSASAARLYERTLGMKEMAPGRLVVMQKLGPAAAKPT